ncbi:glycosyltransferase family 4 protein [Botrimarina sp.]|uniref:glycosyltransferase family 4 protein n=1 Tax=Botrimarina sp. TaxID=2795802 RepID=UPI0032EC7294
MRFLFVKPGLAYPRSSGHDVHTYEMMRALAARGAEVALLTREPATDEATSGLDLAWRGDFGNAPKPNGAAASDMTWAQRKFASYWGVPDEHIAGVGALARELEADAVVAVGLGVLPYLSAVRGAQRVWYAADEWVLHHWTLFSALRPKTYPNLKAAAVKGFYERAFAPAIDRVWVVSEADARAVRRVMGVRAVDVVPNGVDATHFQPVQSEEISQSAVFWGRLDFEPNIDALRWFLTTVWPRLIKQRPGATFSVFGFNPCDEVRRLCQAPGVEVIADLPDLRDEIAKRQVVVLPFISGAGIKNKLLEAAAMARPIVVSPTAVAGLNLAGHETVVRCERAEQWAAALGELWDDPNRRAKLGAGARQWVTETHSWRRCAAIAMTALSNSRATP